jgi:enamine deaminase RidA (YjgF/YER057c/UK114 family)
MTKNRRALLQTAAATVAAAATGAAAAAPPAAPTPPAPPGAKAGPGKKVHYRGNKPTKTPLFSGAVSLGNLLFIAGKGAHFLGDIKAHTKHVLDEVQKELENAGSSMDKVLKCNVYLNTLADYAGMNEMFLGRFGETPPVRTTIAAAGGIPGDSLVEIDVIAYI